MTPSVFTEREHKHSLAQARPGGGLDEDWYGVEHVELAVLALWQ